MLYLKAAASRKMVVKQAGMLLLVSAGWEVMIEMSVPPKENGEGERARVMIWQAE